MLYVLDNISASLTLQGLFALQLFFFCRYEVHHRRHDICAPADDQHSFVSSVDCLT